MALNNLLLLLVCEIGVSFREERIPPMQLANFLNTSILGIGDPLLQRSLKGQLLHKFICYISIMLVAVITEKQFSH